jgi:hypothetical protein
VVGAGQEVASLDQEHLARGRERGATAVAVKQRHAELGLEPSDLLADAWLREVQTVGGAAKVKLLCDGDERAQLPQFHGRMIGVAFHRSELWVLIVRVPQP